MKRTIATVLSIILVAVSFIGCSKQSETQVPETDQNQENSQEQETQELQRYNTVFIDLFDTVTTLIGYSETEQEFEQWAEKFYAEMQEYHKLYDIYNNYGENNIKTINDNAGVQPIEVSQKLIDLLNFGVEVYHETNGITNMAMGSVLKIWHDYREVALEDPEKAEIPPMELLEKAAKHMDIEDVVIDEQQKTVYLKDPEMSLDLGSLAKGYAVEMVCRSMEQQGLDHYLLNAGGNVRAIGTKPDGIPWSTGLENPYGEQELMGVVNLDGNSLVTSGNYQRFYEIDGFRYHHIIDPYTLMPKNHISSVTILCDNSGLADALSTALFNMSVEDGLEWVEQHEEIEAFWLLPDRSEVASSGFIAHMAV